MNQVDKQLADDLRTVISRLLKVLRSETKNEERISLTESSTLAFLYINGEKLPSELAIVEKVTAQSMSQIINKLLARGFVEKTASETDKRKMIITITELGKQIIEKRRHEKEEWLAQSISQKTTDEEKYFLTEAIRILGKLVE